MVFLQASRRGELLVRDLFFGINSRKDAADSAALRAATSSLQVAAAAAFLLSCYYISLI